MDAELIPAETRALAEHEAAIERGLTTFVEVGNALLAIRDQRLYRAEFATFEDYCRERWGFSDSRARQLIGAAQTVTTVTNSGLPAPANEGQARELARVPEPERAEVWRETIERTGGKPTAAAVRETYAPPAEPEPVHESDLLAGDDWVQPAAEPVPLPVTPPPDPQRQADAVQQAMDRYLPPDPEAPHRKWRIGFLSDVKAVYRPMHSTAEIIAEQADDECVDALVRAASELSMFLGRVLQLRSNGDATVVPMRGAR